MGSGFILTVAVLGGTGKLGPGLAKRLAAAGYKVIIGSRQAEKAARIAADLNEELSSEIITGLENRQAAGAADISILTVRATAHEAAIAALQGSLDGKILVDSTARVDFRDPLPPDGPSAPRKAQDKLGPQVQVVAAFQNVPSHALQHDPGEALDVDVMVCADDKDSAEEVIQLIEGIGMRGYFAGRLDNAIILEGLTALLIAMNRNYQSKKGAIRVAGIKK